MYREVLAQEKKLKQFGIGALELRKKNKKHNCGKNDNIISPAHNAEDEDCEDKGLAVDGPKANMEESSTADISCTSNCWGPCSSNPCHTIKRLIAAIKRKFGSVYDSISNGDAGRSNNSCRQTRAVMYKALSYCVAFTLTFMFPIIISIRTLVKGNYGPTLNILVRIFYPLQGFFNFIVFIHPKVMHAKTIGHRRGESISWYRAFVRVLTCVEHPHRRLATEDNNNPTPNGMKILFSSFTSTISSFISTFLNRWCGGAGIVKKKLSGTILFRRDTNTTTTNSRPVSSSPPPAAPSPENPTA